LSDTIEWLIGVFASDSPGFHDDLVLVDSTPVECARSVETIRRSQLGDAADYGWCASHSRYFWGFRLHGLFALDGTPRALILTSPKTPEREVCLTMLERCQREGHLFVLGDLGYAGREFESSAAELDATIIRPRRKNEGPGGPHLAPIRQRIESIFQTCKDLLTLERHGARTLHGLGTRIKTRFLALAAAIEAGYGAHASAWTPTTRTSSRRWRAAMAVPAARPPPPSGTTIRRVAGRSSAISSPTVP
jgi:hypothetical protein